MKKFSIARLTLAVLSAALLLHLPPASAYSPLEVELIHDKPLYLLVRWGYLHYEHDESAEVMEWNGSMKAESGTVNVVKEVLMEQGDIVTSNASEVYVPGSTLNISTKTTTDWDGLIVKFIPQQMEGSRFTVELNGIQYVLAPDQILKAQEVQKLDDNGHEIEFLNVHKLESLPQAERDQFFVRKSPVLDHFFSVEKYLERMVKDGKVSAQDADKFLPHLQKSYVMNFTDNMKMKVDKAFKGWKISLEKDDLSPKKLLRGLKVLMNRLNIECRKSCYVGK